MLNYHNEKNIEKNLYYINKYPDILKDFVADIFLITDEIPDEYKKENW